MVLKNMKKVIFLTILTSLVVVSPNGYTEMYKWVDADGNTHYTQQPPPDGMEGQVIAPPPKVDTEHANKELQDNLESFDERRVNEQKVESEKMKQAEQEANLKQQCDNARKQLQELQMPRIMTRDKDGNPVRMPEEQRQGAIEEVTKAINENCK